MAVGNKDGTIPKQTSFTSVCFWKAPGHDHRKKAEEKIREHTVELAEANERLQQQIILRERAEEERRRSEQRLQQAQKAESLGRMAGAIAHHFNNLLGVVMGTSNWLQRTCLGDRRPGPTLLKP